MEKIVKPNLKKLIGNQRKHPESDEFIISCAVDMIREFQPDLLMVHPAAIDGARHKTGLFGEAVNQALNDSERWTERIFEAAREAGIFENTDFIMMSDHGQLDIKRTIHPNVIFRDHGLIHTDEKGRLTDWKAFCKSAGMSVQVYLKDPMDVDLYEDVYTLLHHMADEGLYGFTRVYSRAETEKEEHLSGDFSFVLETDGYTTFGNDWRRPIVRNYDLSDYRFGRATHGYHPDRGPQPTMLAMGPSFKAGAVVERRPIVDATATFAQVLGVSMETLDGTCIRELLQ